MVSNPFDMSDVRALERHLARVAAQAERDTRAVLMRGAVNIKRDWRSNAAATAGKHAKLYPRSIGFDGVRQVGPVSFVDIGPDKAGPQGALGNLLEYGSSKNPPHRDGGRALDAEAPRFEAQMAAITARGLSWW